MSTPPEPLVIRHRHSGAILREVPSGSLVRANLAGANLANADLTRANLTRPT